MSCHGGTAGDIGPFPEPDDSGGMTAFMQVMPVEFTRTELHKLLDKARALAQYGIFDDTKRDLLVDLAETLDLLDAMAAREELDILEMTKALRDDPHYIPHFGHAHPRPDTDTHVTHNAPPCGPNCPYNED